jgi:hypothetical protein
VIFTCLKSFFFFLKFLHLVIIHICNFVNCLNLMFKFEIQVFLSCIAFFTTLFISLCYQSYHCFHSYNFVAIFYTYTLCVLHELSKVVIHLVMGVIHCTGNLVLKLHHICNVMTHVYTDSKLVSDIPTNEDILLWFAIFYSGM